ncbi:MAG TPA: hypothetical protein VKX16_14015 [Chloroflexota bacterium]|nr:hypothetical protein [Chloroflexota bacterium]
MTGGTNPAAGGGSGGSPHGNANGYLGRAALAGVATGLRSFSVAGVLIISGVPGLPVQLRRLKVRTLAGGAVAFELIVDKLPATGSRLEIPWLTIRAVVAASAGAVLARGARRPALPAMLVASSAALAGAKLGHDVRVGAARRFPPLAVAIVEDGIAFGLAAIASGLRR